MTEETNTGLLSVLKSKKRLGIAMVASALTFVSTSAFADVAELLDAIGLSGDDAALIGWGVLAVIATLLGFVLMLRMLGMMGR